MNSLRKAIVGRMVLGLALAAGLATSLGGSHAAPSSISPALHGGMAVSELQEVKLRKLHLVRPDLIPYPIAYEVFC